MHIYSMYMFRKTAPDQAELFDKQQDFNSLNFMYRKNAVELCDFAAKQLAMSPNNDQRVTAEEADYLFHVQRAEGGICAIIVTDKDYPSRAAFCILREMINEFTSNNCSYPRGKSQIMADGIVKYQDPANADKILKIQSNLEETKQIMVQNLEKAIGRGEALEVLVEKSNEISSTSKAFAREAKKTNSCCH